MKQGIQKSFPYQSKTIKTNGYLKEFLQHLIQITVKFIKTLSPQLIGWEIIALVGFIITTSYRVSHKFLFSENSKCRTWGYSKDI